ncbi:hypothetical protein Tco_1316920 [Tanacetum coccineum]
MPHDSPLQGGYTPGSVEGNQKLNELTNLCTKLINRVTGLENDLKRTKQVYGKAITKLLKKVKHLEDKLKSTTARRKAKMVLSDEDEDLQVTLTKAPHVEVQSQETFKAELSVLSAAKILAEASNEMVKTYNRRRRSTDSLKVSTAEGLFSTTEEFQGSDEKLAKKVQEEEQAKALEQQEQERINLEAALELQKHLDQREETDNIDRNTIVEQVKERQSGSMIRYQTLKKKPVLVAQARRNMMIYLKNVTGYKMGYFKGLSYDQIRPIFEKEYNRVQTLFKKDTEVEKTKKKRALEEILLQESFKKLRTAQASSFKPIQEQPTGEPKELSEEELKKMMEIVPVEEIKA